MSSGILAAAWISLALGQTSGDVFYTNTRNHAIPVNVPESLRADLREFLLYASTDQGRSWRQVGAIPSAKSSFAFYAPGDGTYWFQVASVNRQGVQDPDDKTVMKGAPHLKMVIDTAKPIMKSFQAQRQGDEIFVSWEIQEDHPDLSRDGMKLEYQVKDALIESWKAIPFQASLKGQMSFNPGNKQALVIRLTARDLAGNESYSPREVAGILQAAGFVDPAGDKKPPIGPIVTNPHGSNVPAPDFPKPLELPKPPSDLLKPPGDLPKPPIAQPGELKFPIVGGIVPPPVANDNPADKVLADSRTPPQADPLKPAPPAGARPTNDLAPRKLPLLQYVNQHLVKLQYEIKRHGPSGIGGVEIWMTKDDGASWEAYAKIRENEVDKESAQGRQERDFEFIDERRMPFPDGVYGLNLVVRNRAGLGRTPRPGDAPEIRIEIDTEKPLVQLVEATADPQNPGQLLLKWYAADKNLTAAPINLEYADKLDGVWQPIKLDLENSGRYTSPKSTGDYSWKVPPGTPVQVYLRVRARDKAGNEGIAVTATPQFVDLVEPEGALIGVVPQLKK